MGNDSFSSRLSADQVKQILDELDTPWREYGPNEEGWVDLPGLDTFEGYVGINVNHGGWVDHKQNGIAKMEDRERSAFGSGDIVDLVRRIKFCRLVGSDEWNAKAIKWIQKTLGFQTSGTPVLGEDHWYAKDAIAKKKDNYTMVPNSLLYNNTLSGSARLVWMAIHERCGRGKYASWAGPQKIADDLNLGLNTVRRAIKELKSAGFLLEGDRGDGKAPKRFPMWKEDPTQNG